MIRFDPREVVDLSRWEEHKPFDITQTSVQTLFNGGLPNRAFIGGGFVCLYCMYSEVNNVHSLTGLHLV